MECLDGFRRRRHVCAFAHCNTAICEQCAGIVAVNFVLSGRRHGNVAFFVPRAFAFHVFNAGIFFGIFSDATAVEVLQFHHVVEFFARDAFRIVDVAIGVGEGDRYCAQLDKFFGSVLCHISRTGDADTFALDIDIACLEHFKQEVDIAVAGGFRANERPAECRAFAGERAGVFACQFLVHAVEIAHFASAHAYVAGRYIRVGSDIAPKFGHESLAEAHHLGVRLAAGREIRTPFCSSHG